MAIILVKKINGEKEYVFSEDKTEDSTVEISPIEVIRSTYDFRVEDPVLDSLHTMHDLNEVLNLEAADENEAKQFNEYTRGL